MSDTEVKERPILFSSEMVRAILADKKTETRRVVKLPEGWSFPPARFDDFGINRWGADPSERVECPYGRPGERLWVRETFGFGWDSGAGFYSAIPPSGADKPDKIFYKADGEWDESNGRYCWRSSIHMPRFASRLALEITRVRVQRIKATTSADCCAEGCGGKFGFMTVWNKLNANRGYGWETDPLVWVIKFKRA